MNSMMLSHTNGSTPHGSVEAWLRSTAREFFSGINWDDNPPEVQEMKITTSRGDGSSLSLLLSVSQFFLAVNWDDTTVAAVPAPVDPVETTTSIMDFTLEDFSELF